MNRKSSEFLKAQQQAYEEILSRFVNPQKKEKRNEADVRIAIYRLKQIKDILNGENHDQRNQ